MAQDNELPIQIIIDPTGAKSGADQVVRSIDDIPKRAKGGLEALQKSIRAAANFDVFKDGGQVAKQAIDDILARGKYAAQERIKAERSAKDQFSAMWKEAYADDKRFNQSRNAELKQQLADKLAQERAAKDQFSAMWKEAYADDKRFNRERAEANKAAEKQAFAQSPQGVFKQAGIRSPQDVAQELAALRQARQLWEDAGKGTEGYHGALQKINSQMNVLESGNARARGSFHKMTAALASMTFELTGAVYGLTAIAGIVGGPAMLGVNFLKTIEDAKLGMTGILLSMGEINGKAMNLPQAMGVAEDITKKLADNSMKYAIGLEELVTTFRSILAPGLAAKMNLDQISQIATIGAIAVKSIGLDSRQVVQEIRDLVAGGIQAASSTLATSLGLKDSDIKAAKASAQGLFGFLEDRLSGFALAAAERQNTLSGAFDLLKIKVVRLFADEGGFEGLKNAIKSVSDYIGVIDEKTGKLTFNQELVRQVNDYWSILKAVGSALGTVVGLMAEWIRLIEVALGAFVFHKIFAIAIPLVVTFITRIQAATVATLALGTASKTVAAEVVASSTVIAAQAGTVAASSAASRGGLYGVLLWGTYELADFAVNSKWVQDNIFATMMAIGEKWDQTKAKMGFGDPNFSRLSVGKITNAPGKVDPSKVTGASRFEAAKAQGEMQKILETLGDPRALKEKHLATIDQYKTLRDSQLAGIDKSNLAAIQRVNDEHARAVSAENKRFQEALTKQGNKDSAPERRRLREEVAYDNYVKKQLEDEINAKEQLDNKQTQITTNVKQYNQSIRDSIELRQFEATLAGKKTDEVEVMKAQFATQKEINKVTADYAVLLKQVSDNDKLGADQKSVQTQIIKTQRDQDIQDIKTKGQENVDSIQKVYDKQSEFSYGASKAWNTYANSAGTAAEQSAKFFGEAFKTMEDSLTNFVMTGKLTFGSFVQTVLAGLARMAIQKSIVGIGEAIGGAAGMMSAFGFAQGGAFDAGSGISAFSNTIVNKPTLFPFAHGVGLMGEKSGSPGEAIMPLTRMPSGDLGVQMSGGSGGVNAPVYVTVSVEGGNATTNVEATAQDSKQLGNLIGAKVREVILQESRPGGYLNK